MVFFNGVQFRLLVHHSHPRTWEPVGLHKDSINYEVLFEMNGFHLTVLLTTTTRSVVAFLEKTAIAYRHFSRIWVVCNSRLF